MKSIGSHRWFIFTWWILSYVMGWLAALGAASLLGSTLLPYWFNLDLYIALPCPAIGGMIAGTLQLKMLRGMIKNTWWWLLACASGGALVTAASLSFMYDFLINPFRYLVFLEGWWSAVLIITASGFGLGVLLWTAMRRTLRRTWLWLPFSGMGLALVVLFMMGFLADAAKTPAAVYFAIYIMPGLVLGSCTGVAFLLIRDANPEIIAVPTA